MKLEEINALYEKAYANVGPEQADLLWQSWAGRAANAWPALYREMVAARAWRDAINLRILVFNGVTVVSVNHDVNEIGLVDEYDAARRETDK